MNGTIRGRVQLHNSLCPVIALCFFCLLLIGCAVDEEKDPMDMMTFTDAADIEHAEADAERDIGADQGRDAGDSMGDKGRDGAADFHLAHSDVCDDAWYGWHRTPCGESQLNQYCEISNVACNDSDESGDGTCVCIDSGTSLYWFCRPSC